MVTLVWWGSSMLEGGVRALACARSSVRFRLRCLDLHFVRLGVVSWSRVEGPVACGRCHMQVSWHRAEKPPVQVLGRWAPASPFW